MAYRKLSIEPCCFPKTTKMSLDEGQLQIHELRKVKARGTGQVLESSSRMLLFVPSFSLLSLLCIRFSLSLFCPSHHGRFVERKRERSRSI